MAMSVIQGGSGFSFMALPMYEYLCRKDIPFINIEIDDVPNEAIQYLLQEVILQTTITQMGLTKPSS